ncbi:hypothetical protein [Clostridium kluyveri]|uniref:hypothetical protein n=1 Tax=Clostridium kluyveri TaxID=1534 RepID=UPI0018DE5DD1|nr:hypothetical protein [Clostridium kluyveri]
MTDPKKILKSLRHDFYLRYKYLGFNHDDTQHAYELYKSTLIGNLKEGKMNGKDL